MVSRCALCLVLLVLQFSGTLLCINLVGPCGSDMTRWPPAPAPRAHGGRAPLHAPGIAGNVNVRAARHAANLSHSTFCCVACRHPPPGQDHHGQEATRTPNVKAQATVDTSRT